MQEKQKYGHQADEGFDGGAAAQHRQQPNININMHNQNIQQQGLGGGVRIYTKLTMADVLGHFIIWAILIGVTFGIGALFWPYSAAKLILNSMVIGDRQVRCELGAGGKIGHAILWGILIICTLGLASPFYIFGVVRTAIDESRLV